MKPKVEVVAYTKVLPIPEELHHGELDAKHLQNVGSDLARLIEMAGRTCYDSYGKGRSSSAFHRHILEVGHGSVLEHASISFFITGISRGCSHELVRHRVGVAISQRSTRYVDESESEWVEHPLMEAGGVTGFQSSVRMEAQEAYWTIADSIERALIGRGIDKQTARKQARGAARGVLGNALSTELIWTANIRALRNVIEQRASRHADAEIRLLANALYEAALPYCPEYLSDYSKVECPDGVGYELVTEFRKV